MLFQAGGISHRMSCGPFQVNLGGEQGGRMRSRNRNARFSCLGGGDGDEESAPKSELEQRYAKVFFHTCTALLPHLLLSNHFTSYVSPSCSLPAL